MTRLKSSRAFSLIEAVAVMVTLSVAVPACMFPMRDAAAARMESLRVERAATLASAVADTIRADAASQSASLGFAAFSDSDAYLNDGTTGLYARLRPIADLYAAHSQIFEVTIGPLVSASGVATGDPDQDAFRWIAVNVKWTSAKGRRVAFVSGQLVCAP